jgi:hypothetical protein
VRLDPIYGDRLIFNPKNHPRRPADDGFYLRSDDWCAVSYWYQFPLATTRAAMPDRATRIADLFDEAKTEKGADL